MKMSKYTKVWILILGTMLSSVGIGKANALSLTYQGTTYQVQGVETTLSDPNLANQPWYTVDESALLNTYQLPENVYNLTGSLPNTVEGYSTGWLVAIEGSSTRSAFGWTTSFNGTNISTTNTSQTYTFVEVVSTPVPFNIPYGQSVTPIGALIAMGLLRKARKLVIGWK